MVFCSPHYDEVHRFYTGYHLLKPETEDGLYESVHNCVDIRDEIPLFLPLQKGVPRFAGFGKEGLEQISGRIYLLNYGLRGI